MSASEKKPHVWRWVVLFSLVLFACWYEALPRVVIYYSKSGAQDLKYVLNTQHSILQRDLQPGATTGDAGHIFPDGDFFMMFDWWAAKAQPRCISITPKRWHTLEIYLDETGKIDLTETSPKVIARLTRCPGQPDPLRP